MTAAATGHDLLERGMALREQQDMEGARATIAAAAAHAPNDPQIALAHAHVSYESWQPATELFLKAEALVPGNLSIIRSRALAMTAEGAGRDAVALLAGTLVRAPGWVDGHRALATLRTTHAIAGFDSSFADAVQFEPDNQPLRLAWFHCLATARDWDAARVVLNDAEVRFGPSRGIALARAFFAAETGEAGRDEHLFDHLADVHDVGLDLCRVRHFLRIAMPERAAAIAEAHSGGPVARHFWPYLSLAWRLTDYDRADWLDGGSAYVSWQDEVLDAAECAELATTLRRLLVLQAPYLEQSVRGGVQTDRHLLFHPDPVIQRLRAKLRDAVARYVAELPDPIPGHPLLGAQLVENVRDDLRFEGSWSVLLRRQGFHASHTHNMGWISSALYVQLPPPDKLGEAPAGCFSHGMPPPELGLALPAYGHIEPKPGRLALFPSTMWHGTVPFDDGERLSVAFDVKLPALS